MLFVFQLGSFQNRHTRTHIHSHRWETNAAWKLKRCCGRASNWGETLLPLSLTISASWKWPVTLQYIPFMASVWYHNNFKKGQLQEAGRLETLLPGHAMSPSPSTQFSVLLIGSSCQRGEVLITLWSQPWSVQQDFLNERELTWSLPDYLQTGFTCVLKSKVKNRNQ